MHVEQIWRKRMDPPLRGNGSLPAAAGPGTERVRPHQALDMVQPHGKSKVTQLAPDPSIRLRPVTRCRAAEHFEGQRRIGLRASTIWPRPPLVEPAA